MKQAVKEAVAECKIDSIDSIGYSLVFKGCNANKVAEYYDKTECVRDNATGLIWQGHTPAGTGVRESSRKYTNYDNRLLSKPSHLKSVLQYAIKTIADSADELYASMAIRGRSV